MRRKAHATAAVIGLLVVAVMLTVDTLSFFAPSTVSASLTPTISLPSPTTIDLGSVLPPSFSGTASEVAAPVADKAKEAVGLAKSAGSMAAGMIPFGGQIVTLDTPVACGNGTAVTIKPAGASPITLLWTPGVTMTYLNGPPTHEGQWVLGMSAPGICLWRVWVYTRFGGFYTYIPIFMMQMLTVGTSM